MFEKNLFLGLFDYQGEKATTSQQMAGKTGIFSNFGKNTAHLKFLFPLSNFTELKK